MFFWNTEAQTQGLMHARQILYPRAAPSSPCNVFPLMCMSDFIWVIMCVWVMCMSDVCLSLTCLQYSQRPEEDAVSWTQVLCKSSSCPSETSLQPVTQFRGTIMPHGLGAAWFKTPVLHTCDFLHFYSQCSSALPSYLPSHQKVRCVLACLVLGLLVVLFCSQSPGPSFLLRGRKHWAGWHY